MAKRLRRTAEEARREILQAAEAQLAQGGPDSIRLQDVAAAVGISHPTVLHHFGSREALVAAVVEQKLDGLRAGLLEALAGFSTEDDITPMLDAVFEVMGQRGYARVIAWLTLTGATPMRSQPFMRIVAEVVHGVRSRLTLEAGCTTPLDFDDTLFTVQLAGMAMLADGLVGNDVRRSAGLDGDAAAPQRFRRWLGQLLDAHLRREVTAAGGPIARS